MKSLKKTRRIQVIVIAAVALAASTALIGIAMKDGINLYRSPTQVLAELPQPNEVFRMGGRVEPGSLIIGESESIRFNVTDVGATVPVTFTGIRPDLFEEGQDTIATGRYVNGVFEATELLAKHDETYIPKEVVDQMKEQGVYRGDD